MSGSSSRSTRPTPQPDSPAPAQPDREFEYVDTPDGIDRVPVRQQAATTPAPSFTPGPFRTAYSDNGDFRIMRGDGDFGTSPYDCFDKPKHLHHDIQALCEVTNSLYAYAKAVELRHIAWSTTGDHTPFWEQLRGMGWQGWQHSADEFLATYRAAALAQAEGRNP